jgi:hypothetical protein
MGRWNSDTKEKTALEERSFRSNRCLLVQAIDTLRRDRRRLEGGQSGIKT